jgi:hypothetical protein
VNDWRANRYPSVTATSLELLDYWRRDGRSFRFFFAQLEAAETIIFINEARRDFLQGLDVPLDEPSDEQKADLGYKAFRRYACKMATGSGKTTVMGMLAAWSILNKVNDRANARYSDVVVVVCPNVTIRRRLGDQAHDYVPDFVIRLKGEPPSCLILETKGFDPLAEVKAAAAGRWVAAVNADGRFGTWKYAVARKVDQIREILAS